MNPIRWSLVAIAACTTPAVGVDAGYASDGLSVAQDTVVKAEDHAGLIEDTPACDPPRPDAHTPDAAACCSTERCAPHAMRCDPATCRCAPVPCAVEGAPCDDRAVPGLSAPLVCARDQDGLFCHPSVESVHRCPDGLPWCTDSQACVCGGGACRVFGAPCPSGQPCQPLRRGVAGSCAQTSYGFGQEGAYCTMHQDCAVGLLCADDDGVQRCLRPGCGWVVGAPSCEPGRACRPFRSPLLLGSCQVPCDPSDLRGPCASNERCLSAAPDEPSFCHALGVDPLPTAGAFCENFCRTGATCVDARCEQSCRPGARGTDDGACPADAACVTIGGDWFCARRCDPWGGPSTCASGRYCVPALDACGRVTGRCAPYPSQPPSAGQFCGSICDTGLACVRGSRIARCRQLCLPGVAAGRGACPAGSVCRTHAGEAPWGGCVDPCVAGDGTCRSGEWCDPIALDPVTNRWTGFCI